MNWPTAIAFLGLMVLLSVLTVLLFGSKVTLEAHCSFAQWRPLPDGLTWRFMGSEMRMAPEYADCQIYGDAPNWKLGMLLNS